MKRKIIKFLLSSVCLLGSINTFAHDVEVENADGVTIYYNYTNNGTELAVTYRGNSYGHYSNEYTGSVVIPETVTILNKTRKVTSIGSEAFYNCTKLTSVTIPASMTSIGSEAFRSCSGLTSVTIPASVTSIGSYAFSGCSGLTSVTIPESVKSIGSHAFYYCKGLKKVIVKNIAAWCGIFFGDNTSNPLYYAHLYSDEDTEITDLVIPGSVTGIGSYAFSGCSGLTSVTISTRVNSIGVYAFSECSSLTSVTIPTSVKSIGSHAFYKCSGLTSVTIPGSVTDYLGYDAFAGCSGLTSVTISDGVTSIGSSAFSDCSKLTSVTIPASVTSIGGSAFLRCSGLTSVTIPDGVTSIGGSAFYDCSGLTSVTIPASVTSIGSKAFDGCNNLADFVSLIQEPFEVSYIVSDLVYNNGTLYVPEGTMEKYKATKGWKNFVWMEEGMPAGIKLTNSNGSKATEKQRYTIGGESIDHPQRGVNVVKMSDGTVKKVLVK